MKFNDVLGKNESYDHLKSHRKIETQSLSRKYIF